LKQRAKLRGWGTQSLGHQHIYWNEQSTTRKTIILFRLASGRQYPQVICFGFRGLAKIVALAATRLNGSQAFIRSDTNQAEIESEPSAKRALRRLFCTIIIPRKTVAWAIGSQNERFWRHEVGLNQIWTVPYEAPLLPGYIESEAVQPRESDPLRMRILYVGRLLRIKNVELLIDAFKRLSDTRYQGWILTIVGTGPNSESLKERAMDDDRIRFVGSVEYLRLGEYFQASDVLVLVSKVEPWGLVVNEALGFGLFVIASESVGSAHDLLTPGDPAKGIVLKFNDVSELELALVRSARELQRKPRPPQTNTAELMARALGYD